MRELDRGELINFLQRKIGRWDSVWWNGELLTIGQAIARAHDLLPSERVLCSRDEVLLLRHLQEDLEPADLHRGAH